MTTTNIYTNREKTIAVSKFIDANRSAAYLGHNANNNINYFDVNGIVWEVFQDGCGNYPETTGMLVAEFIIN